MPLRRLSNGSFPSVLGTPAENVRYGQARAARQPLPGPPARHPVRIIEYTLTVRAPTAAARVEPFRLVTSLLDPDAAPAADYGEPKTRLRGAASHHSARSGTRSKELLLGPRIKW